MKVGYARISTPKQSLQLQIDELEKEGCRPIYSEIISGVKAIRPEWEKCFNMLREGDILYVHKIDRIGRNAREIINRVYDIIKKGVEIRATSQGVSSKTSAGRLAINILCSIAENEREIFRERSMEGIKAARARGNLGGRKCKHPEKTIELIKIMYESKKYSLAEICALHKISRATVYNYIGKIKE